MWKTHISRLHHGPSWYIPILRAPCRTDGARLSPWREKLIPSVPGATDLWKVWLKDFNGFQIAGLMDIIGSWKWIKNWFWLILFTPSNQLQHSKRFWPILMKFCADGYMWHSPLQLEAVNIHQSNVWKDVAMTSFIFCDCSVGFLPRLTTWRWDKCRTWRFCWKLATRIF